MKFLIFFAILSLTISEQTKCTADSKKAEMCVESYIPVCAYGEDGLIVGTFQNECFACKDSKVASFDQVACVAEAINSPTSENASSSNTTSTSTLYYCNIPKSENPICPAVYQSLYSSYTPTCGLFNANIQCIKAPCGQNFGNECEACSNANVDSYYFGDCSEPIAIESPQTNNDFVNCTDPRPEMCTMEYTDTCAFTEFPCYSDQCQKSAGNHCSACADENVIGYLPMKCSDYAVIYATDDGLTNSTIGETKYQCSTTRPTDCDTVVSQVCAQLSVNGTNYDSEFTNECVACSNSAVTSYYKGQCQTSIGVILGLVYILAVIL